MLDALDVTSNEQHDSETLAEHVFRRIQAAIVQGEIPPGSKISEPELARTYGISRGPLREAIHRLEGQKLLVRVPHVGARVVSLSHAELIELYEIRESLEGMACRLAAERMSQAEIDGGTRRGVTTTESARIAELEREVRELKRANQILKSASAFFAAELDRPSR